MNWLKKEYLHLTLWLQRNAFSLCQAAFPTRRKREIYCKLSRVDKSTQGGFKHVHAYHTYFFRGESFMRESTSGTLEQISCSRLECPRHCFQSQIRVPVAAGRYLSRIKHPLHLKAERIKRNGKSGGWGPWMRDTMALRSSVCTALLFLQVLSDQTWTSDNSTQLIQHTTPKVSFCSEILHRRRQPKTKVNLKQEPSLGERRSGRGKAGLWSVTANDWSPRSGKEGPYPARLYLEVLCAHRPMTGKQCPSMGSNTTAQTHILPKVKPKLAYFPPSSHSGGK